MGLNPEAVPDLLTALKAILALDKAGYLHRDPLDTNPEFKQARAAIRKATEGK